MKYGSIIVVLVMAAVLIFAACTKKGKDIKVPTGALNLKKIGAAGDGKTDDSDILNSALKRLKPGGTLFIPAGTYRISKPLLIDKEGLKIIGVKGKSILKFDNSFDWYKKYHPIRLGMVNIIANGVHISNLVFDQNFRGSGKGDGELGNIACIGVGGKYLGVPTPTRGITIENCEFYDFYADCISVFNARSSKLTIRNNKMISSFIVGSWKEAGVKGEQAVGIASGDNILVEGNDIQGALDDAIAIHKNSKNVIVRNNTITTTGGRILMNGTTNGLIENNKITYIQDGGTGILITFEKQAQKISKNNGIRVLNNEIRIGKGIEVKRGIYLCGPGDQILVEGNKIFNENKDSGIGILISDREYPITGEFHFGEGIVIRNNTVDNFKEGIIFNLNDSKFNKKSVSIEKNTLRNLSIGTNVVSERVNKNRFENVTEEFSKKDTKARISRVSKAAVNSKEIFLNNFRPQKNKPQHFSDFLLPEKDIMLKKLEVQNATARKFSVRIIDVSERKTIFNLSSSHLSDQITEEIILKKGKKYRVVISSLPLPDHILKTKISIF